MNLKYHYLLVAVAALSLGGCSTDDTCTEPENGGYKIAFTVAEDSETRTTFETLTAGDFLRWVPTDEVGIYTVGNNLNPNTYTVADVNQHPVEFIGTLKKLVSNGDKFYAYYPYDAEQSTDPTAVKLSIPAEQTQTEVGVYNGQSHPLVALPMTFTWERDSKACRMSSVRFRQLGAIVEMQFYSSDEALRSEKIRSVTFESETPLAGDFTFDLTSVTKEDTPQISGYELTEVTTTLDEPAAIPATKDEAALVYLTIAPGDYMGQIVVKTDAAQYTFRLKNTMTFGRAVIKGLPADLATAEREALVTENDPISFEDAEVKRICVKNWDTNGDGELSYKEAAAVTSIGSPFRKGSIYSFNELRYFIGLQSIGDHTFASCSSLTSIHIPDGVTTIEGYAFNGCSSLTSINIPDGVTSIGDWAFDGCSSLTSINIPQTVSSIGKNVFSRCHSLSAFEGKYASADHRCLILDGTLLAFAPANLSEYTIPDGVTSIGESAFQNCSSLTSIQLPDGVTAIGVSAFQNCSSLMSIQLPDGVTAIGNRAFSHCSSLTSISIPQTVSSIGEGVFSACSSLSAYYGKYASADHRCLIQNGALFAFAQADLTEYTVSDGVTAIGNHAFYGCNSLKSIQLPDGVTSIGKSAFYDCSSLTSINIPDEVAEIGESAFRWCGRLTSITIPNRVATIGYGAFMSCGSLTSVYCKPIIPPTLDNDKYTTFGGTPRSMRIYVPEASVDAYKTAWSSYASLIVADNN